MAKRQRKRGMAEPQAKAKPKSAPAPSLPSEWGSRYPRIAILFGIVAVSGSWLSAHWSPTVVWRCFDRINEWRRDAGLWPAVEMMAAECFFSDSIPLVSATLQHGKTLPELYRHYEKETAQHGLMLQTAKLPGVHAFYAEAGMGKSTVAAAVLQELYRQGVPAAFVVFEMPGELKRQVATSLQTTSDKLSDDLTGALVKLRKRGSREVVVVIDAIDEHDLTDMDTETLKLLAGVSWMSRGFELPVFFSVICLMRTLETKQRFEKMNGGHKITGGIATEPCPPVSPGTLQSYASQLQLANDDYKKWTDKAPYLIVLRHFAEGKYNMSKVVEHFEAVCYTGGAGTAPPAVWVRQIRKDGEKFAQIGSPFKVTGELADVDDLKKAGDTFKQIGNAFQVKGELANVDDLKKAIKAEKPNKVKCDADEIDIFSQQDGSWIREDEEASVNRGTSKTDCYGFTLPSA